MPILLTLTLRSPQVRATLARLLLPRASSAGQQELPLRVLCKDEARGGAALCFRFAPGEKVDGCPLLGKMASLTSLDLDFAFAGIASVAEAPQPRQLGYVCLLYTSPSPRDLSTSRMPSSA